MSSSRIYEPWVSVVRYTCLGVLILAFAAYFVRPRPSLTDVRVDGVVVRYVMATSSGDYSPVIAYEDILAAKHELALSVASDRFPIPVGKTVSLYYQKQNPSVFFLAEDPYLYWFRSLIQIFSIPFFLVSAVFLLLMFLHVSREVMAGFAKVAPFLAPLLIYPTTLIAIRFFYVDFPMMLSYHGPTTEWSTQKGDSPFLLVGVIIFVSIVALWALRWPIALLRGLRWAGQRDERGENRSDAAGVGSKRL